MNRVLTKYARFGWRASRNLVCALPGGLGLLFPREKLANRFGRGDAEYALQVFRHHVGQLRQAGFENASNILEVGPGRNLGTALLWWSSAVAGGSPDAGITLWDVHANATPTVDGFWRTWAQNLLLALDAKADGVATLAPLERDVLNEVATGRLTPRIDYRVCSIKRLSEILAERSYDLIYSHAALEHVWDIAAFWTLAGRLTALGGWHSHRIDLADHGRRDGNYIEMLEWSPFAWWLTMRFAPGAINRWRTSDHENAIAAQGIRVLAERREMRAVLPVPRRDLARPFAQLGQAELRATAVDIVARAECA